MGAPAGPAIGPRRSFRYDAGTIFREFARNVPCRHSSDRSHCRAELPAETLVGRSVFLVLYHRHHQYRRGNGAASYPALDHHRRVGPQAGNPRRRRGRRTTGARAGPALRIYLWRAAADRVGHHDRPLSDGERERRAVRDRRADLFAGQPRQQAGVELELATLRSATSSRLRRARWPAMTDESDATSSTSLRAHAKITLKFLIQFSNG